MDDLRRCVKEENNEMKTVAFSSFRLSLYTTSDEKRGGVVVVIIIHGCDTNKIAAGLRSKLMLLLLDSAS
jgi:hypothetical protein